MRNLQSPIKSFSDETQRVFFTSIAKDLCNVFKDSAIPRILVSRVKKDFALHAVDASFIRNELAKLRLSKSTGLDKIQAKLLKDAASVIAKPVTYLINLTISTGEIPSHWKETRVISTAQVEYK